MAMKDNRPIGVLDSGIGGLTVLKALKRLLPNEQYIYIGDTARVPYGTRNLGAIEHFAQELVLFLLRQNVKALVVACNTLSATALKSIKQLSDVPVFDAVSPVVAELKSLPPAHKIAVFSTLVTARQNVYAKALPDHKVFEIACPLLVPMIEDGRVKDPITETLVNEYASSVTKRGLGAVVLACTHFPVLTAAFRKCFNPKVHFYDSAMPLAREVQRALASGKIGTSDLKVVKSTSFNFTDLPLRSAAVAFKFFGSEVAPIYKVDLAPTLRRFRLDDQEVTERVWGTQGPIAVILHGWGSGSDRWQEVGQLIHDHGFRVHALDLPGFGASSEPATVWDTASYAEFIESYIAQVICPEQESITLIGHSFGAQVALAISKSSRVSLRKLVLIAAAGIRRPLTVRQKFLILLAKLGKPLVRIMRSFGQEGRILNFLGRLSGSVDYSNATPRMREILKKVVKEDARARLSKIKADILMLWAKDDQVTPLKDMLEFKTYLPSAKSKVFEGGGHNFYRKQASAVAKSIIDFMQ